jgi:hypothetical protein
MASKRPSNPPATREKISVLWTKHLKNATAEEQAKFLGYLKSSNGVLEILQEILRQKMAEKASFKETDYKESGGAWPFLAADRNGYNRALLEICSLITLVEEDHA